jgi:hypothetical protein
VHIISAADVDQLDGTTVAFRQFILDTALPKAKAGLAECQQADPSTFNPDKGGVWVYKFAQAGYASGEVDDCSGYAVLWKNVDGAWKQVLAGQEAWMCGDLTRFEIPRSFAGGCYGPAELFGPDDDAGITLGMSAEEVRATGATVSDSGTGCPLVRPQITWDKTTQASDISDIPGYLSTSPDKGVVVLVAQKFQMTPLGIRLWSSPEEVKKAYPDGHTDAATKAWLAPIDAHSSYRFDFQDLGGSTSVSKISMLTNDQDCIS